MRTKTVILKKRDLSVKRFAQSICSFCLRNKTKFFNSTNFCTFNILLPLNKYGMQNTVVIIGLLRFMFRFCHSQELLPCSYNTILSLGKVGDAATKSARIVMGSIASNTNVATPC
jgi:hypothetical protein